ncbi:MAG: S-methyl-5-thioribose-1-phosphate isomerase [Chitinivibrionales bacterium]|nr:S-methyl-5-thioribose-1-phosphate isomerase [Chitinivibrionales bacterium]
MTLNTIEWKNDSVVIIDQTQLPTSLTFRTITSSSAMYDAIKELAVRGAPAIGIAAAFGLYLGIRDFPDHGNRDEFINLVEKQAHYLCSCRPTAVNLAWACNLMRQKALDESFHGHSVSFIKKQLLKEAMVLLEQDTTRCRAIGENGFNILKNYSTLLTHCNAGGLATAHYGTALSPIYFGQEQGKLFHVYVDETRPLLQGSRLTAYELQANHIPMTLICDNMAAVIMAQGKVDAVIVGADRIAANGDVANKIGTYGLSIAAAFHRIPFYVAAPSSTIDSTCQSGESIPIEERNGMEITHNFGRQTAPSDIQVYNPAFDITPHNHVSAIITEKKVLYPPYRESLLSIVEQTNHS